MRTKHPKEKNKKNISSRKTSPIGQKKNHSTPRDSRSDGWFTEKDAKTVKKEVIGRFYST